MGNQILIAMKKMSMSRKLILGFFIAIIVGSILLYLPFSLQEGQKISFLTAVFTITSAICVTGLSVIDVGSVLSIPGQLILLSFIQLGGLGVMTFSSLIFIMMGKKMGYSSRVLIKEERNAENSGEINDFIKKIIMMVLTIEGIGAIFLTLEFWRYYSFERALYYGVFHSISAFCNAGFALFSNNLEGFTSSLMINLTIAYLIILGGIGFSVINSVLMAVRQDVKKFTLTSKVAILISLFLTFGGMILFFILEYNNPSTLGNLNFFEKILASFFQSVTTRTAGFSTIPTADLGGATIFMFCILMFIGASPGSTGGGVKTTTFGVIILYVIGVIQGKENINLFNRKISWDILNRALAILIISIIYVSAIIMMIMTIEKGIDFEKIVFEVVSAFGTVGLSIGTTTREMSTVSRMLLILTMFVGRLGPLTIALALGEKKIKENLKYPKENILVG